MPVSHDLNYMLICSDVISIVLTLSVAVGVQERPAAAPQEGPWASDWKVTNNPRFSDAVSAISAQVFAYAGTPGFFSIVAEMRDPRQYGKSLIISQIVVTVFYIGIGVVVYYFCGSYVASPALGSAGVLMKKVCYGLALPSLFATVLVLSHVCMWAQMADLYTNNHVQLPAKYIFVRILRGSRHLTENTIIHWCTWLGSTFGIALIAYLIASGIPIFDSLVSLVGALLGTLMSFQPMGFMWLYDNWSRPKRDWKWVLMVAWSIFVILSGTFLMIAGTYGSIVGIIESYQKSGGSGSWSCADNSNST